MAVKIQDYCVGIKIAVVPVIFLKHNGLCE